jgi:hypothetical protein
MFADKPFIFEGLFLWSYGRHEMFPAACKCANRDLSLW